MIMSGVEIWQMKNRSLIYFNSFLLERRMTVKDTRKVIA